MTAHNSQRPQVLMLEGNFTFVRDWAEAATQIAEVTLAVGVDVRLANRRGGLAHEDLAVPALRIPRLHLRPKRVFSQVSASYQAFVLSRALSKIAKSGPPARCIHTHFFSNADGALLLKRWRGIPFIHTEHSSSIVERKLSTQGRKRLIEVCREASAVFAVSKPLADAMREYGVDREIHVAHNPVQLETFTHSAIEPRFPISEGIRFVTVGWLLAGKDHEILLRAFSELCKQLPDATLDIVGDGPLLEPLRALSRTLSVAHRVTFRHTESRSEVAKILAASHVYVHSSRSETFGVALVEAWASGLPVVTFECGGVSGLAPVIGGQTIAERTIPALANGLVAEAASLSSDRSHDIRRKAQQHFDPAALIRELETAYRNACA